MRNIDTVVLHCADTPPSMDIGAEEINQWHLQRGWSGIGYNFVLRRSGLIELGRDLDKDGVTLDEKGAHVLGHNHYTIGICLVGGKGSKRTDKFLDNFTIYQSINAAKLINAIQVVMGKELKVVGHHDLDPGKECPGFIVSKWWGENRNLLDVGVQKGDKNV